MLWNIRKQGTAGRYGEDKDFAMRVSGSAPNRQQRYETAGVFGLKNRDFCDTLLT